MSVATPGTIARASALRLIPEGTVRVAPTMGIPAVLQELKVDPSVVFASAGISPSLLDDPENVIAFAAAGRLLARCVAQTGRAHFGLLVGRKAGLSSLGLVGFLAQHSASVGTALGALVRHLPLHDRGALPVIALQGEQVRVANLIYQPGVEASDQICDIAMTIACNILRGLCGPRWRPTEVLLAHRRPRDPKPFLHFFEAPIRFDAEQSALVFPASWLEHPLPGADPALRRLLQ